VEGMKQAPLASLFHSTSNKSCKLHDFCPVGLNNWCGYQHDRASYKHGPGLSLAVTAEVKPVSQRLCEDGPLRECLHGKTQDQNESLNGTVWQKVSKKVFGRKIVLKFGL